jgi:hypothetical protein
LIKPVTPLFHEILSPPRLLRQSKIDSAHRLALTPPGQGVPSGLFSLVILFGDRRGPRPEQSPVSVSAMFLMSWHIKSLISVSEIAQKNPPKNQEHIDPTREPPIPRNHSCCPLDTACTKRRLQTVKITSPTKTQNGVLTR